MMKLAPLLLSVAALAAPTAAQDRFDWSGGRSGAAVSLAGPGVPLLLPAATADTLPGPGRAHLAEAPVQPLAGEVLLLLRDRQQQAGRISGHGR